MNSPFKLFLLRYCSPISLICQTSTVFENVFLKKIDFHEKKVCFSVIFGYFSLRLVLTFVNIL